MILDSSRAKSPPQSWTRRLQIAGLLVVIVAALLFAAWTWLSLHWAYSEGERAGYVQKFSRKGWLCKTWEGELALVAVPGSMPEIFHFSVRDEAVAKQLLTEEIGQRVSLSYAQHVGIPSSCYGETEYFITGVRSITALNQAPATPITGNTNQAFLRAENTPSQSPNPQ